MRRHIPTTSMLLCFEAAARFGSFSRAAKDLSLTNSAISRSIQGLEEFLGITLFVRDRQRVYLNDAGQAYLASVSEILERLESVTASTIARAQKDLVLKLGTYPTFGSRWLMPRLPDFTARHPDVPLTFTTGLTPFDVHSGMIDVAIQHGHGDWPESHALNLWSERLVAVVSANSSFPESRDPKQISELPQLSLRTRPRDWEIWFSHHGLPVPAGHTGPIFETYGMLIGAARAALGVALVPELYVSEELSSGGLVASFGPPIESGAAFYAVCDVKRRAETNIRLFLDWLAMLSTENQSGVV